MLSGNRLFRAFKCCIPRHFKHPVIRASVFIRRPSPLRSAFLLVSLSFALLLLLSVSVVINSREKLLIHGIWKTTTLSQQDEPLLSEATNKISTSDYLNLSKLHFEYFQRTRCNKSFSNNKSSKTSSFMWKSRKYYEGTRHFQNVSFTKFNELNYENSISNTGFVSLEVLWSKEEERFKVCRFHNACINREGVVFLPQKLKEVSHLFRGCVSKEVVYVRNKSLLLGEGPILQKHLYGLTEARKHIPLFLTDVIPSIYANELLRNEHVYNHELSYRCFTENGSLCTSSRDVFENINASNVLLIEDKALKLSPDHWVPQFTNMLLDNVRLVSLNSMFQYENFTQLCFRSIVSYSPFQLGGTPQNSILWAKAQETFFQNNGLYKSLDNCSANSQQQLRIHRDSACQVHVVVVNRKPGDETDPISSGRDFQELDKIERKLIHDFKRTHQPRINLKLSVIYFEEMTFPEQVYIMQTADVIIGIHGAGLTNLVFAKASTPVLEIFPFFYFPIRFKMFSYGFNLDYSYLFAEPDPNSYFRCINYRTRNGLKEDIFVIALDTWREALRRKTNATNEKPLDSSEERRNIAIRSCARSQRLHINITKFSERVLSMAKTFCNRLR